MRFDDFKVGDEIIIPAWWNHNELTKCRILTVRAGDAFPYIDVRPLEGNPHGRFVSKDYLCRQGMEFE